jgi:magnesium chelatase accessory protein
MMANWDLDALARDLPRLQTRLLLVHGDADAAIPISSARSAAALVGDGRLTALAGLGHLAHEERPDAVADAIRAFAGGRG